MIRRVAIGVFLAAFFGLCFFLLAWRPSITPIERPSQSSFSHELVAKGEALSAIGHCASCHTEPGGQPFAGGYPINTPFGVIYGTNITPDPKTGIGNWSLEAFTRVMHEGVARDGSHLFPAFPYYAYTKLSDDDVKALYAYLMTRPAVSSNRTGQHRSVPLNVRALQEGWKILFFRSGRIQSQPCPRATNGIAEPISPKRSVIVRLPHSAQFAGRRKEATLYAGAVVEGWIAPALDRGESLAAAVDTRRFILFPAHGHKLPARGGRRYDDSESFAMRWRLRSCRTRIFALSPSTSARRTSKLQCDRHRATHERRSRLPISRVGQPYDADANFYASACMSCHYNAGRAPLPARPELALNSALTLPEPTNFIQVVLNGVGSTEGAPGMVMPHPRIVY